MLLSCIVKIEIPPNFCIPSVESPLKNVFNATQFCSRNQFCRRKVLIILKACESFHSSKQTLQTTEKFLIPLLSFRARIDWKSFSIQTFLSFSKSHFAYRIFWCWKAFQMLVGLWGEIEKIFENRWASHWTSVNRALIVLHLPKLSERGPCL